MTRQEIALCACTACVGCVLGLLSGVVLAVAAYLRVTTGMPMAGAILVAIGLLAVATVAGLYLGLSVGIFVVVLGWLRNAVIRR